jgi:predicted RNase H-like nuclease
MSTLLVGFDSAWTATNEGGLVGALRHDDGSPVELGEPQNVSYPDAEKHVLEWQAKHRPASTIIMLDQPTIVPNATGQRPVENVVASPVGRRYGAVQPANTSKKEMFGTLAPVWGFLRVFGVAADPMAPAGKTWVLETYPVLTTIALGWMLPDVRPTGRLPKYNPANRPKFSIEDWRYVCDQTASSLREFGLADIPERIEQMCRLEKPTKGDQDGLDACLCLLVALHMVEQKECLMVGDMDTGYMVVPYGAELAKELEQRCIQSDRMPSDWVHPFRFQMGTLGTQ